MKPDFISWNRGGAFYGMLAPSATEEQLACQARTDPDGGNRVEAMGLLRDKNCVETCCCCGWDSKSYHG